MKITYEKPRLTIAKMPDIVRTSPVANPGNDELIIQKP